MPPSRATKAPTAFVCDCEEWMRSACEGLPFYKEHEGKRYCVLHYPGKDKRETFNRILKKKLESEEFEFGGVWFPDKVDFTGITFTKGVDFTSATFSADATFSSATFNETAHFGHATFRADAYFDSATFNTGAYFYFAAFSALAFFPLTTFNWYTDFSAAKFSALASFSSANFNEEAVFNSTEFGEKAYFHSAKFKAGVAFPAASFNKEAEFSYVTFKAEAEFSSTTFREEANFKVTTFNGRAYFNSTTFSAVCDFSQATFKDYVRFAGTESNQSFSDESSLYLPSTPIEKPDHLFFHTLKLRPHWFVNVDARKFVYINVDWNWRSINTRWELQSLQQKGVLSAHRLLAIACRNLAVNAEENHRYEEASRFRYMSMDARRLERWRGFAFWSLGWWYWLASGYGERVWRASVVLIGVWAVAAALYTQVGFVRWEPRVSSEQEAWEARRDEVGQPLHWQRALTYSLGVMTLQKPEPRPTTDAAQAVVMLETILGPVQAALLALAIRRKFMR